MFEALAAVLILVVLIFIGAIVAYVFYCINLQDLLKECDPDNRQVPPANVWLMFIPFFNLVYTFILSHKISETLRLEYESRGQVKSGDYLKTLGIALSVLLVVSWLMNNIPVVKQFSGLFSLSFLIVWIIYWVQAAKFKKELRSMEKGSGFRMSEKFDILD